MSKKILLKNGFLVDPSRRINRKGSLLIEGDLITVIGKIDKKKVQGAKEIDLNGQIIIPGCIDLHTHLREPGQEEKETISSGTKAAAKGGFTSVCAMPNTEPPLDTPEMVKFVIDKSIKEGVVNVFVVGAISKGRKGEVLTEFGKMVEAGAVAFSDDGNSIKDTALMRQALEYTKAFKVPLFIHAEDKTLSYGGVMNESYISTVLGLPGIPNSSEEVIIARDLNLLEEFGGRIHFCHVSSKKSVNFIKDAKKKKLDVTAEVTPHHFSLTDESVTLYDTNTKVNPPLREENDKKALIIGIKDGTIDVIATDHAPHAIEDKNVEYGIAAFGISGLETAIALTMKLVKEKKITFENMVYKLSVNPARILGLKDRGALKVGYKADLTIIDPKKEYCIKSREFCSKGKNTPFEGWSGRGCATMTIVNGQVIYSV